MVMASKYELQVKIPGKTAYQKDGQKKQVHGNKAMPRWWVEDRNSHENNEIYIIDEEATEKYNNSRAANVKANELKKKKANVSMADLVDVVAEAVADKPKKKAKKVEEVDNSSEEDTVESLRAECDALEIEYHPRAGVKKLKELLNK